MVMGRTERRIFRNLIAVRYLQSALWHKVGTPCYPCRLRSGQGCSPGMPQILTPLQNCQPRRQCNLCDLLSSGSDPSHKIYSCCYLRCLQNVLGNKAHKRSCRLPQQIVRRCTTCNMLPCHCLYTVFFRTGCLRPLHCGRIRVDKRNWRMTLRNMSSHLRQCKMW